MQAIMYGTTYEQIAIMPGENHNSLNISIENKYWHTPPVKTLFLEVTSNLHPLHLFMWLPVSTPTEVNIE